MAVFKSTRELDVQDKSRNFKSATGWKATAMSVIGYKRTGQKNVKGKYIGGMGLAKVYGASALASGSDAQEVIDSSKEDELKHQMGTAQFAASFVGGGGGSDWTGGGASSGGSSSGGGMFSGMFGQGGGGAGGDGTMMGNTMNQTLGGDGGSNSMFKKGGSGDQMTDKMARENKQAMMDGIDSGEYDMTDEEVLELSESNYKDPNNKKSGIKSDEKGANTKKMEGVAKATDKMPIIGEFAGLYTEKLAMADKLDAKAKAMFNRTTRGTNVYAE